MRKIATSIVAALFFAGAIAAGSSYDDQHSYILKNHIGNQGDHPTIRGKQLASHYEGHEKGDELRGSQLKSHRLGEAPNEADDCLLSTRVHKQEDCSCGHDDWGCGGGHYFAEEGPHPHLTSIHANEKQLTATLVPAQVLTTSQNTEVTGNQCEESRGQRTKAETERFSSIGNFSVCKFDV